MGDMFTKEKRSEIMSHIKGEDTKPEVLVRKYLFKRGFRYRKNDKRYPGKPDIVLPKYKIVILVNGCFWHGHEKCKYATIPKSNTEYWLRKIQKNKERDAETVKNLEEQGFRVITIWECELKKNTDEVLNNLVHRIKDMKD